MAHILIVEDESNIRLLIQKVLEADGHLVAEASDGIDALEIIGLLSHRFDLILLDVRMPHMDGNGFLAELRKYPTPSPVIIVSAYCNEIEEAPYITKLIPKPFTRAQLLEAVNQALALPKHDVTVD